MLGTIENQIAAGDGGGRGEKWAGLAVKEFFEEEAGEALGAMADDAVFLEKIVEDDAEAEFLELPEVDVDGFGALGAVTAGGVGGGGAGGGGGPHHDAGGGGG